METFISMWYDASETVHLEPIIATFTTINQTDVDSRAIYSSEKIKTSGKLEYHQDEILKKPTWNGDSSSTKQVVDVIPSLNIGAS